MQVPASVRRTMWRILAGGLACAAIVAAAGLVGEHRLLGDDAESARGRITAGIQREFSAAAHQLDTAVARVTQETAVVSALQSREPTAARHLFEALEQVQAASVLPALTVSIYGPDARPVAWAGRPGPLPAARLNGPDALFLAPSPVGLRLARVAPLADPAAPERRLATVVADAPLPQAQAGGPLTEFVLDHRGVTVPLRLPFEARLDAADAGAILRAPSGEPLAAIEVPETGIAQARARWRSRVRAALAGVGCIVLLLLAGPGLDWRRATRTVPAHAAVTAGIVALLVGARILAWYGVRWAGWDRPALVTAPVGPPWNAVLASPLDLLATVFLFSGLVALAAGSFEQWRQRRGRRVRVVPDDGRHELAGFVAAQLLGGVAVGGLVLGYQALLHEHLTLMPFDVLQFSLHPFELERLAVAMALVILHATLLALAVLVYRVAVARWVVAADRRWLRSAIPLLWAVLPLVMFQLAFGGGERAPVFPAAVVVVVAVAAAWHLRRYRASLEHASQAARLTALLLALAVPSLVFYPSLVDAADRSRRQLFESRYAPEVQHQRRDLQLLLNEALVQIDALPDLAELVQVEALAIPGAPPYETAFRVWERTVLEERRLTSSIELHDAAGSLLSRFALKLPHTGGLPVYQETTCQWELFEEVSPFFAEERRLLHAGRGICLEKEDGPEVVGAIAVHVMLDYSNLSFISAQSPYVALLRGEDPQVHGLAPRDAVEFVVYGWSRRPLYMSGRDAWPLTEDVFERIYASRDPFWARITRGDTDYDVLFLNDRGGIYALGYPVTGAFGHVITMAELVALAGATFLMLLAAGFLYGLIASRTPASGRALLREVRASFYRKLFIAFVAAAVVPVLVLALVTRAYVATLMQNDLEMEASRTAASASRVVEDVGVLELTGLAASEIVDDDLVTWLSRVIAQDVNIFDRAGLIASSERSLFAYGLLPRSTQGDVYRAIMVEGRPSYVTREAVGATEYLVAAAPVRLQNRQAILTVPLTLRQREIEAQIDELDRRVLLAVVLFIVLGALIGYSMAERIADPVNRLMKATGRIARGELTARVLTTSADEFRRLVEAFNRMAADLQRQRVELERSNRLAAWADMARQVAHDIKNPLTPIQLNAEHLRRVHQDRDEPMGRVLDECVDNILQQVKLLRQIAGEFSSFASSPTVRAAPTPLAALIDELVQGYRTGLRGKVAIDDDVPDTLPPVLVDKAVLGRALTNVIENALHAMPRGGTLRIAAREVDASRVELAIADTGIGMDAAALERIFEPYFSTRASGTGLGLTIAKRNVELNGGTIAVESEPHRGTTVRITLPTAPEAA